MPDSPTPRMFTCEEVRENFLMHIAVMIDYWEGIPNGGSPRSRLEGLAHSILVALDGGSAALPGFVVAPAPHSSDREYCIANGENFYPETPAASCDIAGELHERMYGCIRKARATLLDRPKPTT